MLACGSCVEAQPGGLSGLLGSQGPDHRLGLATRAESLCHHAAALSVLVHQRVQQCGHSLDHICRASLAATVDCSAAQHDIVGPSVIEWEDFDDHLALLAELLLVVESLGNMFIDINKCGKASDGEKRSPAHIGNRRSG